MPSKTVTDKPDDKPAGAAGSSFIDGEVLGIVSRKVANGNNQLLQTSNPNGMIQGTFYSANMMHMQQI